jgi:predicted Zn-dependent peptidase
MNGSAGGLRCPACCRRRVRSIIFEHVFDRGSRGESLRLLSRAFAALSFIALVTPALRAQGAPFLGQRLPEDPAVRLGTLANGLAYYIKRNGYPEHRAELRLVVNAGSVLEDEDQRGIAHLLEHMAFDGSTHFPKHAIWDYLQRGWPFTDLLTGDQRVESLTTSELQAAIRRYLDPTHYVQVSLIPEDSKS